MTPARLLTRAAIRQLVRSRMFVLGYATISLFFVVLVDVIGVLLWLGPTFSSASDPTAAATALGTVVCTNMILFGGLALNVSSSQPLIREKAGGMIESLLATPATARDLWIARSLAASVPGIVVGLVGGVATVVALNLAYFIPSGLPIVIPGWMIVNAFLLLPAVFLLLSFVIHQIGLPGSPISGNILAQVFVPAYASLLINLSVRDILSPARFDVALVELGMILVLVALLFLLRGRVTKERIVLSCKR